MGERRYPLMPFLITLLGLSLINTGHVTAQPQPTFTVNPSTNTANPGETFQISIYISGAVDMYTWQFRISWQPLLLNVTSVTEGPFLKSGGFYTGFVRGPLDTANEQGWMEVGCTRVLPVPGRTGSGYAAYITFLVEEVYSTPLDLYDSCWFCWIGHLQCRFENVIEVDGSFDNTGVVGTLMNAELVRRSGWPEHHHFNIQRDEDFTGTYAWNTLYGKVKNTGSFPVYLIVGFTDLLDVLTSGELYSNPTGTRIDPGAIIDLSVDFGPLGAGQTGKCKVSATAYFSYGGTYWYSGPVHEKTFGFSVVYLRRE